MTSSKASLGKIPYGKNYDRGYNKSINNLQEVTYENIKNLHNF